MDDEQKKPTNDLVITFFPLFSSPGGLLLGLLADGYFVYVEGP